MGEPAQGALDGILSPAERCAEALLELKDDCMRTQFQFEEGRERLEALMKHEAKTEITLSGVTFRLVQTSKLKLDGYKKPPLG